MKKYGFFKKVNMFRYDFQPDFYWTFWLWAEEDGTC